MDIYSSWVPKNILTEFMVVRVIKHSKRISCSRNVFNQFNIKLCEKTGADIEEVAKAIGMDQELEISAQSQLVLEEVAEDILNLVYIARSIGLNKVANC